MKKVYEAPIMETIQYVFSQTVATSPGDYGDLYTSGLFPDDILDDEEPTD